MKITNMCFVIIVLLVLASQATLADQFEPHKSDIYDFSISNDGRYLVTSSSEPKIILWDLLTGEIKNVWNEVTHPVAKVVINNEKIAYIKDNTNSIFILDYGNKLLKKEIKLSSEPRRINISGNGRYLVTGHAKGKIMIWEFDTNKFVGEFSLSKKTIINLLFFKNNDQIIVSDTDKKGEIIIFDIKSKTIIHKLKAHNHRVRAISLTNDGKMMVTGSYDKLVKLWDFKSKRLLSTLEGHNSKVSNVAISNDKEYAVTTSFDNNMVIWDIQSRSIKKKIKVNSDINKVSFFPTGHKFLITSSNHIEIWDAESGLTINQLGKLSLPDLVKKNVNNRYKTYSADSFCKLNLDGNDINDYSIVLKSNKSETIKYVVSLNGNIVEITEIESSSSESNCFKNKQVLDYNELFKNQEGFHGHIEQISSKDTVCNFIDETEAKCWQYDSKINKMVPVGGWAQ